MIEQLKELVETSAVWSNPDLKQIGLLPQTLILLVSLVAALLIAWLYLQFYSGQETGSRIHRAFPLLGLAITAIFICIQFSLPLSLGLLGALSIVRFRTPIKEPEEIGFLMLVIATSIAAATFNIAFLGLFLVLAVVAIVLSRALFALLRDSPRSGTLIASYSEQEFEKHQVALLDLLGKRVRRGRLDSLSRSDGRVVMAYSFSSLPKTAVPVLQKELAEIAEPDDSTLVFGGGS